MSIGTSQFYTFCFNSKVCFFLTTKYSKLGSTISSKGSAAKKPPIIATPSGWLSCVPGPIPRTNGSMAKMAQNAVMSFGRSRVLME